MNWQDMNFYLDNEPDMKEVFVQIKRETGNRYVEDPLKEVYRLAGDHAEDLWDVFESIFVINPSWRMLASQLKSLKYFK